jgi:phosphoribosylaminoimidazole-succinocarboxamide synthase
MKDMKEYPKPQDRFREISDSELPAGFSITHGKVRDIIDLDDHLLICTSDRISAFDRVLGTVPYKGEVLNKIALFWFEKTKDILQNHIVREVGARTVFTRKCTVLPVEVVVRGYLTGSAWRDYSAGKKISGIELPGGMQFNQKFDRPLLTPSSKAEQGEHDLPLSREEILERNIVDAGLWKQVEEAAFALFERGSQAAAENGLILVDTKYEFGTIGDELFLIDEVHTPDSSRFWYAEDYEKLFAEGKPQNILDKEYLRSWLMEHGYMGDGTPPEIPEEVFCETANRYITAFETITGTDFVPSSLSADDEKKKIVETMEQIQK